MRVSNFLLLTFAVASNLACSAQQLSIPPTPPAASPSAGAQSELPSSAIPPSPQPPVTPNAVPPESAALTNEISAIADEITDGEWETEPAAVMPVDAGLPLPSSQSLELLQEFGCQSITYKRYARTQRTVRVFIFSFPDSIAAFGAYSTMRLGSSNVIKRGDASSEDEDTICLLKGKRFITITSSAQEDEVSKALASRIANELAQRIPERGFTPPLISALPILDRMPGTERIFFGPHAARKYMSIPFLQSLQLSRAKGAACADYQFQRPDADRLKTMVIDYGDPTMATVIYQNYSNQLAAIHKTRPLSPTSQISRVGNSYLLCMQAKSRVYLIAGAKKKVSPLVLARQVGY